MTEYDWEKVIKGLERSSVKGEEKWRTNND